jgi:pimeloyl-ACP methyl ester carboxylesterase
MNNSKKITIQLANKKLTALEWHSEQTPIILALHGWLDNAASFAHLAPFISGYRFIALDLLGHGESDSLAESDDFGLLSAAELIKDVITQLTQDKVILLGHSIGATIASMVAATYPQCVEKLIMVDAFGPLTIEVSNTHLPLKIAVAAFKASEQRGEKIYSSPEEMLQSRAKVTQLTESQIRPLVTRAIQVVESGYCWAHDPKLTLASMMPFNEAHVKKILFQLAAPTLVVEASQGLICQAKVLEERKPLIAHLRYVTLQGGHHLHLSHPAEVAQVMNDFLESESCHRV